MIAVIFEAYPIEEKKQEYIDIASRLKPMLAEIDGFISIERFASLQTPGKILSLSFSRDEKAVEEWRNISEHRTGQAMGIKDIFTDYRIRVGDVIRDYSLNERENAPSDSNKYHKTS